MKQKNHSRQKRMYTITWTHDTRRIQYKQTLNYCWDTMKHQKQPSTKPLSSTHPATSHSRSSFSRQKQLDNYTKHVVQSSPLESSSLRWVITHFLPVQAGKLLVLFWSLNFFDLGISFQTTGFTCFLFCSLLVVTRKQTSTSGRSAPIRWERLSKPHLQDSAILVKQSEDLLAKEL